MPLGLSGQAVTSSFLVCSGASTEPVAGFQCCGTYTTRLLRVRCRCFSVKASAGMGSTLVPNSVEGARARAGKYM